MNIDLSYYLSIFLRRIYILVIVAMGFTAAAVYVALELPPMYDSRARLLVEAPQIPNELARSTVNTSMNEQLQIIQQRLLTRDNLLEIARQYDAFENMQQMTADQIVGRMQAQTSIWRSGGRREATLMTVRFESSNPRVAAAVANEYVTRILEENRGMRTGLAEQTLDFYKTLLS